MFVFWEKLRLDYFVSKSPRFSGFPTALFSCRQGSRIFNSTKRAKTWSWRKSCAHLKAQKKCGRKTKWRRLFNCNFRGNLEPLGTQEKPENIWQMYSNLCSSNLRLWQLHCRTFSWKPTGFFYQTITFGKSTKIKQFSTYSNFPLKGKISKVFFFRNYTFTLKISSSWTAVIWYLSCNYDKSFFSLAMLLIIFFLNWFSHRRLFFHLSLFSCSFMYINSLNLKEEYVC